MAFAWVKIYSVKNTDVKEVVHELSIYEYLDGIIADTQIAGSITLNLAEVNDIGESIRGTGMSFSTDSNLTSLYSEDEKTFKVTYTQDAVVIFNGWLTSDGIYQDFVRDTWITTLDCVDGLGFLEDLSYVDELGIPFTGNQKLIDIISNCLVRTGIYQNIYTNIDIYYTGLSTSVDVLDNVYYNADRFVKDDGDTIMSCKEVLEDVLKPFGATLTSYNNIWYVYKFNQLFNDDTPTFFTYNYLGSAVSTSTGDFSADLGSQINSFYPHHVNSNQSIRFNKSLGAYRISYKYGLVKSLLANVYLKNVSGTIADWTINSYTNLTLNASDLGVDIESIIDGSDVKNMTSDVVSLSLGDLINFTLKFKVIVSDLAGAFPDPGLVQYKIKLTDGVSTYYWNISDWAAFDVMLTENIGVLGSVQSVNIDMTALPIAGDITVEIWTPIKEVTATSTSEVTIQEVSLSPIQTGNDSNIKGEFHTFQRETKPSAKVEDPVRVNNGDNPSDIYYGTIYKTDATTPTETWFRKGKTEALSLLQISGEEMMRLKANVSQEFTGDFFGFLPHNAIVTIDNITGKFIFIDYEYDSFTNVTRCRLKQIFGDELTDINYALTYDFGDTVKPTIKG